MHTEKVLVTGAEEHQGLAVIRGLGLAGIPVVACGSKARSIGFYSRFAGERACYCSPFQNPARFVDDILAAAQQTGARLVIPSVESTLVALDAQRERLEKHCVLAAPSSRVLECAIDKWKTLALARAVGVPVPNTWLFSSPEEMAQSAEALSYPVAIKPRGNRLHAATLHSLKFKSKYATSAEHLRRLAAELPGNGGNLLAQQFINGQGLCVAAVADRGRLLAAFAYERTREWPLTGGVSVLRQSVALEDQLRNYVTNLLGSLGWHGVAMVEFKRKADGPYVLMEINGRFQASTALSLDAGLNFPSLVYQLYTSQPVLPAMAYPPGVSERWLRGDWLALLDYFSGRTQSQAVNPAALPTRLQAALQFARAFRPGTHYDEFKRWDYKPGFLEAGEIVGATWFFLRNCAGRAWRNWRAKSKRGVPVRRPQLVPPPLLSRQTIHPAKVNAATDFRQPPAVKVAPHP